jgi:class 3 adenylate cyclase
MAGCPSCGHENADDARFCSACGAALMPAEFTREQRKVVTVLFCDLVGSTALGESTDPEALRGRMRRYFEDLRAIIERHGGVVEKFVGDAVMAVSGSPSRTRTTHFARCAQPRKRRGQASAPRRRDPRRRRPAPTRADPEHRIHPLGVG